MKGASRHLPGVGPEDLSNMGELKVRSKEWAHSCRQGRACQTASSKHKHSKQKSPACSRNQQKGGRAPRAVPATSLGHSVGRCAFPPASGHSHAPYKMRSQCTILQLSGTSQPGRCQPEAHNHDRLRATQINRGQGQERPGQLCPGKKAPTL